MSIFISAAGERLEDRTRQLSARHGPPRQDVTRNRSERGPETRGIRASVPVRSLDRSA